MNNNSNRATLKKSLTNSKINQEISKKLEVISSLHLIKDLPLNLINLLNEQFIEKTFKINEYMIKQNDPINYIYLIIKGKFILSLNQQIQYDVEHDIDTFINYQDITKEPFNNFRNYEITGKIEDKDELDLFIYDTKNIFGDIELLANMDKSLFNIRAAEDYSVIGYMDRKQFLEIIEKIEKEFKNNVENKLDMIQERLKVILNQKLDLNFDKMKMNKERISYQISVNHNYKLIFDKLNNIREYILESKNKISRIKYYKQQSKSRTFYKKNNLVKNRNKYSKFSLSKKNKPNIIRSQSLSDINTYEKKVMHLFQFPTVLKNDTKIIFDKFFNDIYNKNKIKKFNLNKIQFDYEPVYLNKFRNISKLEPQKKFEFLYHMKNHLEEKFKKPKNITKNKSNIRQLVTMYNYYITNKMQSKTDSKWSGYLSEKEPIINRSFGALNPEIKNNLKKKVIGLPEKKKSIQRKKPIKLDIIKYNSSLFDSISKTKNIKKKIKSNKLFFNSIISEEIKKNSFNWNPKLSFFNQINNISNNTSNNIYSLENKKKLKNQENKNNKNKHNNANDLNKNKERFSIPQNLSNNMMFKSVKMKSKNIFEILLQNKCETTKNHLLKYFHKSNSETNSNDYIFKINNNVDIRNEDFIKNFYSRNKISRANTSRIAIK